MGERQTSWKRIWVAYTQLLLVIVACFVFLVYFLQATSVAYNGGLRLFIETQDFTPAYSMAFLLRQGGGDHFYDVGTQYKWQNRYAPDLIDSRLLRVYYYLPIFAGVFIPFTFLSLEVGYFLWAMCNILLLGYLLFVKILKRIASKGRLIRVIIVLLIISYPPVVYTLVSGQLSLVLVLALFQAHDALWSHKRFQAGAWLSLFFMKPQYLLVIVLFFLYRRDLGVLKGLGTVGSILVGMSWLLIGTSGFERYFPLFVSTGRLETFYAPSPRVVSTWRGFLQVLFQTYDLKEILFYWIGGVVIIVVFLFWLWRRRAVYKSVVFDFQWSSLVVGMIVLSLHMSGQDRSMLLVPLVLVYLLSERARGREKLFYLAVALTGYGVELLSGPAASALHLELHVVYMLAFLFFVYYQQRKTLSLVKGKRSLS